MAPAARSETWLVAGAARGIGAAIVEQVLEKEGTEVYAGALRVASSTKLASLKSTYGDRLHLVTLDVTSEESANALVKEIEAAGEVIDILVNNAAIVENMTIITREMSPKEMLDNIGINAVGAHLTTKAFLPLLQHGSGKTVINFSSLAGSTTTFANLIHSTEESPLKGLSKVQAAYRASKAAMNSGPPSILHFTLTPVKVSWALDQTPDLGYPIWEVCCHPYRGCEDLKTELAIELFGQMVMKLDDLGQATEILTPAESAMAMVNVINGLAPKDNGKFLDYNGKELPF